MNTGGNSYFIGKALAIVDQQFMIINHCKDSHTSFIVLLTVSLRKTIRSFVVDKCPSHCLFIFLPPPSYRIREIGIIFGRPIRFKPLIKFKVECRRRRRRFSIRL